MDVATGATVRIHLNRAPSGSALLVWSDRCAALARLRHPLLNELVDYGPADARRTFEAYALGSAAGVPAARGARLLTHAVMFLERHGVSLDPAGAQLAIRPVRAAPGSGSRHVFGLALQPRQAYGAVDDLLDDVTPGGVVLVAVSAERGAGLRTFRGQIARAARLRGFTPVGAAVLRSMPWMARSLRDRHVCVLLEDARKDTDAAVAFAGTLGIQSARRHVLVRLGRDPLERRGLVLEPMGVTAMISMIYADPDDGPGHEALVSAARRAEGNPGRFLARLRATPFPDHRPMIAVVHESTPAYIVSRTGDARQAARQVSRRSILSAQARAERLAARGRHASAARLLTRAARVFERRGDRLTAASCAVQLGWILRARGRSGEALEQFERAHALAADSALGVSAAIATGVSRTDDCRFAEAEAALRSAAAAAELLTSPELEQEARIALARCLLSQERHDEAAAALARPADSFLPAHRVRALALSARLHAARGDYRQAGAAASEALHAAQGGDLRERAGACRAMALVLAKLGDRQGLRGAVQSGLAAAAAAHLPLVALRLRAILLDAIEPDRTSEKRRLEAQIRGALNRGRVPPLLRRQLESALAPSPNPPRLSIEALPAMDDLQQFLELAFGALDDRTAVGDVCKALCDRLRAATVQIVAAGGGDRPILERAGRPWVGDLRVAARALASSEPCRPWAVNDPREAAHPITYGGRTIAAVACRWTAAVDVDLQTAIAVLRAGALAVAPSVRALIDSGQKPLPEPAWRDLLGAGAPLASLRDAIARAARAPFPVLIEGESGSGKELVARAIHRLSARRDRRLCAVNCAALSDDLLEAELFGHARGAFTGAVGERPGLFEEADGGTLFLDEVAELSPRAQAKLLRTLQEGEIRRVGENFPRHVDARVIAATNRRLEDEVDAGRFRADLRFRLDVIGIRVPPLRERLMDIPILAAHFWEDAARRVESRASLAPETVAALTRYEWPGNVRQLQNVIASLAVHAPRRGRVPPSLLPVHIARTAISPGATFDAAREDFERRFVSAALARAGGQRAKAARALGVTRQGLAKMMRRLRIEPN
jgi:DNA-binding NtrC family response regulator/tetratricopeptide (TPR) repeat protein